MAGAAGLQRGRVVNRQHDRDVDRLCHRQRGHVDQMRHEAADHRRCVVGSAQLDPHGIDAGARPRGRRHAEEERARATDPDLHALEGESPEVET